MRLPDDVAARLEIEMGAHAAEARRTLEEIFGGTNEAARILRCVVYLAEGNVARLAELGKHARAEPRDVMFWAEYTGHDQPSPRHVRDFNKPFEQQKIGPQTPRLPTDVGRSFDRSRRRRQRPG